MGHDVPAVAATSTLVTGCVEPEAAPFTWHVSPALLVSDSCPPGRSVDFWKIGFSAEHIMK